MSDAPASNGETGLLTDMTLQTVNVGPLFALAHIAERLNVGVDRLRGYADQPGVQEFLGAVQGRGKGARYPHDALAAFGALVAAQVPPKGALAFLRERSTNTNGETGGLPGGEIAGDTGALVSTQNGETGLLARAVEQGTLLAHDRLLTLKEAREQLGVPTKHLRTLPRVFGKVRRVDVLRLIEAEAERVKRAF